MANDRCRHRVRLGYQMAAWLMAWQMRSMVCSSVGLLATCQLLMTAQMVSKGSVAVDGISLTLVDVQTDRFSVALIPHTLSHTTLGHKGPGDRVNLEVDLVAKYVERLIIKEN